MKELSNIQMRVKRLCSSKNMTIAALEKELGFSNGYILKTKAMSAKKVKIIADYFGVSMESLMNPQFIGEHSFEITCVSRENELLLKAVDLNKKIANHYEIIDQLKTELQDIESAIQDYRNARESVKCQT